MTTKKNSYTSKLSSYGALAAGVLAMSGADLNAQCAGATFDPSTDILLELDIDGDGITDVNIGGFGTLSTFRSSFALFSNVMGPYSSSGPVMTTFPYYYPGVGSLSVMVNGTVDYFFYSRSFVSSFFGFSFGSAFVYASAAPGGQIVGLTTGGSVCSAISNSGGGFTTLLNKSAFYSSFGSFSGYTFSYYLNAAANVSATLAGFPVFSTYYTAMASTFNAGTNVLFSSMFGTGSCFPPVPITSLAVEFDIGGETHNGWIEISIDGSGVVTVVDCGYNACSVQEATAEGDAAAACIAVGTATFTPGICCAADNGTISISSQPPALKEENKKE